LKEVFCVQYTPLINAYTNHIAKACSRIEMCAAKHMRTLCWGYQYGTYGASTLYLQRIL